jgi:sphingosine kinase
MFDGIVSVSGDGLFHEIVNGLMSRSDWEVIEEKITLGIIPGGTSNGLVKSLLDLQGETFGVLEAAWLITRGKRNLMDVTKLVLEY